jgi:segregation and condensation protein B
MTKSEHTRDDAPVAEPIEDPTDSAIDPAAGPENDDTDPEVEVLASSEDLDEVIEAPAADQPLPLRVEALLLCSDRPLTDSRIAAILGLEAGQGGRDVAEAIETLNEAYDEQGRSFRIESVAGGRQVLTRAEFGPVLAQLHRQRQQSRLSGAALETLAIIAYRQPIMRADIEAIRGVACGEVLRSLLERRLVRIAGRAEELGRPMLYGTTREFLKVFGLSGLQDLPNAKELRGS